jgi:glucose dehydrogenase
MNNLIDLHIQRSLNQILKFSWRKFVLQIGFKFWRFVYIAISTGLVLVVSLIKRVIQRAIKGLGLLLSICLSAIATAANIIHPDDCYYLFHESG